MVLAIGNPAGPVEQCRAESCPLFPHQLIATHSLLVAGGKLQCAWYAAVGAWFAEMFLFQLGPSCWPAGRPALWVRG